MLADQRAVVELCLFRVSNILVYPGAVLLMESGYVRTIYTFLTNNISCGNKRIHTLSGLCNNLRLSHICG
jgi:hypothetical protein